MKKATVPKAKKAAAKGKAKQEPEHEAAESNELTDMHPLHTQGNGSDGNLFLLGSNLNLTPELPDVGELKLDSKLDSEELPSPTPISTPIITDDELFPDRYIKQPAGASGKVAYVVFNGLSPGIFYNWVSCNNSMSGMDDNARRFVGFYTYEDAHNAWALYDQHGVLPQGIPPFSAKMKRHAEGLSNKMRSTIEVQRESTNLQSPRTPMEGPSKKRGTAINIKSPIKFEKRPETPSPVVRFHSPAPLVASPPPPDHGPTASPHHMGDKFWVVFEGPEPGVYADQNKAIHALGGRYQLNDNYLIAPTRSAANALFVQYYMLGLVIRWNDTL